MPSGLASFLTTYGYLAIFALVFLQELGVPNPVPNEIVLLFAGYLGSIGVLNFYGVFFTVLAADFIGTAILYLAFYFFGDFIFRHKPRWLPIHREKIERLGEKISKKGVWGIYIGRLLPYVRGYMSVGAGLLRIRPRVFLPAVFVSALTWSGGYAIAGKLLGPYWEQAAEKVGDVQAIVGAALLFALLIFFTRYIIKKKSKGSL
jgi:membrane protein DedA with SNARE-associated domain